MSGQNTGRTPRSDAEWARTVEQRLKAIESAMTTRVGGWVLSSVDGRLTATTPGEQVVLTPAPALTEGVVGASPVSGTTFRASRRAVGAVVLGVAASLTVLPAVFDTLDYNTINTLEWDPATCALTLLTEGTYIVDYRIQLGADIGAAAFTPGLLVNGSPYALGGDRSLVLPIDGWSTDHARGMKALWVVRADPGDVLKPAYIFSTISSVVGDAAGIATYFAAAKISTVGG